MNNKEDPVHSPAHYAQAGFPLEAIELTERLNFNAGNALKYIWRAGKKNPAKTLEDLGKAKWYILRELDRLANDKHRHNLDLITEYVQDEGQSKTDWEFSLMQAVVELMVPPELTEEYSDRLRAVLGFIEEAEAIVAANDDQAIGEGQEQE